MQHLCLPVKTFFTSILKDGTCIKIKYKISDLTSSASQLLAISESKL